MRDNGRVSDEVLIEIRAASKRFRTWKRKEGVRGFFANFLAREWQTVSALEGIDLTIRRGEFVGLIGANGAGKTTLLKCVSGITPVSSGSASLFGCDSFGLRFNRLSCSRIRSLTLLRCVATWLYSTSPDAALGSPKMLK